MNTTAANEVRQQAKDLIMLLTLPGASARYAEANVLAGWLTILLESCTQEEANEQLETEVNAVASILKAAA